MVLYEKCLICFYVVLLHFMYSVSLSFNVQFIVQFWRKLYHRIRLLTLPVRLQYSRSATNNKIINFKLKNIRLSDSNNVKKFDNFCKANNKKKQLSFNKIVVGSEVYICTFKLQSSYSFNCFFYLYSLCNMKRMNTVCIILSFYVCDENF